MNKRVQYQSMDSDGNVTRREVEYPDDLAPDPRDQFNGCIDLVVGLMIGIFTYGFCIMKMWEWFLTPQFGIPVPSIFTCYGLRCMCSAITFMTSAFPKHQRATTITQSAITVPTVILATAYTALTISRNF